VLGQVLKYSQTDVDELLKEKEAEKDREWVSRLEEQKCKSSEVSAEKLKSEEKVLRLQKSLQDMKYVAIYMPTLCVFIDSVSFVFY